MALRHLNSVAPDRRSSAASSPASKKAPKKIILSGPNDENLDLLGGPNRLHPQLLAARSSPCPVDALSTAAEEPAPDVEYLLSEDLKALDDADQQLDTLLNRLESKNWLTVCEALNHVRRLSIFHTSSMLPILDKALSLVIKAMKNPRSALCKTAIMASTDLFKAFQDMMLNILEPLLLELLLKASQDKRFVCEEAERALEGMTTWISPAPLMQKLYPYVSHRNPRVRAKAATCFCRSVSRLGFEGIKGYGFEPLIQMAAAQLNDQLPESREAARKLVADLHAAYQHQISQCGSLVESFDAEPCYAAWEQFCSSQLSPSVVQAILRLTSSAT